MAKSPRKRAGGTGKPTKPRTKRRGRPPEGTEDWAPAFLASLVKGASVTDATIAADVHPTTAYERRRVDEDFRKAWNEACDIGTRLLEQEAQRRAFHGVQEPVFHKGECVGHVRKYSDTLLIFLLKARRPEKYREGAEEGVRGNVVVNINVETIEKREELHLASLEGGTEFGTSGASCQQDCKGLPETAPVHAK